MCKGGGREGGGAAPFGAVDGQPGGEKDQEPEPPLGTGPEPPLGMEPAPAGMLCVSEGWAREPKAIIMMSALSVFMCG